MPPCHRVYPQNSLSQHRDTINTYPSSLHPLPNATRTRPQRDDKVGNVVQETSRWKRPHLLLLLLVSPPPPRSLRWFSGNISPKGPSFCRLINSLTSLSSCPDIYAHAVLVLVFLLCLQMSCSASFDHESAESDGWLQSQEFEHRLVSHHENRIDFDIKTLYGIWSLNCFNPALLSWFYS